ncbi:hypothetical protein JY97_09070 [Alkalispirochaeta odontotermitis]|nr:hypothetical protein JY97_09070 [Alkalispirochaeta odontotermitis]CAB1074026.1 hypothetical protein D1AOALGA4SA_2014 [Olavius algarvensis Delta 1 endosymbiont]
MNVSLELIVVHRLPGRIRLRFSHSPKFPGQMVNHIQGHAGVDSVKYTPETENLLIHFDQKEITLQEVLLRAGLSFSQDLDMSPVRLRIRNTDKNVGPLSALAFAVLTVNHVMYLISSKNRKPFYFPYIAGGTTLASVLEHVVQDFRGKGNLHPEVFSVYYLILSFFRGDVLKASTITWFLTFGRHLMELPANTLLLIPEKSDPACDIHRCEYEVTVRNENEANWVVKTMHALPSMLYKAYKEMNLGMVLEDTLMEQMEQVADSHDDIIEGLENIDKGFYLKIEM